MITDEKCRDQGKSKSRLQMFNSNFRQDILSYGVFNYFLPGDVEAFSP